MRNIYRIALVSVLAFSLAAAPSELFAQARRSTSTTSASSSQNKSAASSSRSSSSSASATPSRSSSATTSSSASTSGAARRSTTTTSSSSSSSRSSASSGTTARRSTTATTGTSRNNTSVTTGTSAARTSATSAPARTSAARSTTAATSASQDRTTQQTSSSNRAVRGNVRTTSSKGLSTATTASSSANRASNATRSNYSTRGADGRNLRLDDSRNLNRVPPRERDFMTYDKPGYFYGSAPHFFGYRIQTLPPRYRHITHWGVDYYYYDNVYYRRYGTYYVVCRPPFGVALDIALTDAVFASVRFSYYHNVYRTYDIIDDNYRTIMEQNRIIAQNNAAIAAQNSALALNSRRATSADEIARALGLVQSYADINTEYYYEDGVFYTVNKRGRYEVIVPPAGALVDELPDDYDTIVLNGVEYYKVEDTVYRLVLVDGIPALEVLGQMYGSMARQYNYYYN